MVSKELQDKFYAALESLKDGKNDYILEALASGAKAAFEESKYGYELKCADKPVSQMVAEAVTKLGNAIGEMKTSDNASLIESILDGFNACFNVEK